MPTQDEQPEVSTVNNDHLTVTITKKPFCEVKFDIRITPKAAAAAYQKALKTINKEVNVPGFRKGKAPDKIILDKYSSAIQKEFVDVVLQTGFNDALDLTRLHPLKDGRIKRPVVHECAVEKGARFTVEFETRPVIPSVNLEEIKLKKVSIAPVTEQEQQNSLQNLLLQFAKYEPIEDRPLEENDFADLNVTLLEEPPREVIKNQRTQVVPKGLPSWLRQKVVGLRAGESAEGMTEQDLTLAEKDPNFRSLPFRVTVNAIWNGNLPAVDEELAKKVGVQTVDELKDKIKQRLEQAAEDDAHQAEIQQLEEALVEKYPLDLPRSYIDANKESRLDHYLQQLEKEKRDLSQEDYTQIEQMIERSTIHHLQLFFLMHKVAADHQLKVTQEDLSQELGRQLALMSSGRNSINFAGDREKLHEQLHNLAFDNKVKQFLLSRATYI